MRPWVRQRQHHSKAFFLRQVRLLRARVCHQLDTRDRTYPVGETQNKYLTFIFSSAGHTAIITCVQIVSLKINHCDKPESPTDCNHVNKNKLRFQIFNVFFIIRRPRICHCLNYNYHFLKYFSQVSKIIL